MTVFVVAIVAVLAVVGLMLIGYYNSFVAKRNQADQAFSTIDVMLKKRADLLPNLAATVQEYMKHESGTLERIAQLRSRMTDDSGPADGRISADSEVNRLLGGIMVQVENYPELKADRNFAQLQDSLQSLEEQLSSARRSFNAAVTSYNISIQMFPGTLVAGGFGFQPRQLLEIPAESRRNPDVKALFNR